MVSDGGIAWEISECDVTPATTALASDLLSPPSGIKHHQRVFDSDAMYQAQRSDPQ
jgi:hypothetical protein